MKKQYVIKNKKLNKPNITAKKASSEISDYKKATGNISGIIDLIIHYIKLGTTFTCKFGDINIDKIFHYSLETMFSNVYQIKEYANTLSALIIANQQQEQQFEIDMSTKESDLLEKLSGLETTYKNKKLELEKQSKRE